MTEIKKYPDGSTYPLVDLSITEFTHRINSNGDIIELLQILDAYNYNNITPTVTIPCLYYAQDDRRWNTNSSHNLKLICNLLNSKEANYKIFHPHNQAVVVALVNNIQIIDNTQFLFSVLNRLHKTDKERYPLKYINRIGKPDFSNLILMSPDAGAYKWINKLADNIEWKGGVLSASKYRTSKGLKQQLPINDFEGKDILIIDDCSLYGGTFKGLSKLLDEANVGKKYLAVSHMTIQNLGSDPVTNYFDKVYCSDSKYDKYYDTDPFNLVHNPTENLEIIKMF